MNWYDREELLEDIAAERLARIRARSRGCSDRTCGAEDCYCCHPENFDMEGE